MKGLYINYGINVFSDKNDDDVLEALKEYAYPFFIEEDYVHDENAFFLGEKDNIQLQDNSQIIDELIENEAFNIRNTLYSKHTDKSLKALLLPYRKPVVNELLRLSDTEYQYAINKLQYFQKEFTIISNNNPKVKNAYNIALDLIHLIFKETEVIRGKITPIKKKPETTYEDLFIDKKYISIIEQLFETNGYTIDKIWVGITNNRTELLGAIDVLKKKGIIISGNISPQARIIYSHFGKEIPGYVSERSLTNDPPLKHIEEFERLFSQLE
ncbi:hypothetical protein [Lentimicrobium sp. S6]|uniref:hypothetical protein n=1 Tax=Lentimicrobium sp. S6 TaxID=2735872 RepID=UPI0015561930|nr:hypothetical protein [Lentimicrobium sp. S6]NPD47115.1 hypothetical protein [Lentimicrobium sp. S6]